MTFLDRIKETSTSTGTGTFTLGGAVLGYKVFTNGTYKYCIVNETESEWEVGEGTVASGILTRTTIEASSNGGAAVSFSAGTKYVFNTVSAAYVNSLVPYTGATAAVNLGAYGLTSDYLQLSTTPTASGAVGRTIWNDSIGSTQTTLKGGSVVLKNGVDLVARVVNKVTPAATLTKATYKAVRVSGAQGQRLAIAYAQANTDNNSADTIGLVCETIAQNQEGFIITVGQLTGINTTGSLQGETWADGDVLYLSPTTAGNLTNIKPNGSTGHIVVVGYVEYAHAINGSIYVKIMNGWELSELHDTYINAVANNDVLVYETATTLWKNKSISTILGYTPANDSLVVHLAGAENITGVKTFQNAIKTTTGNNLLNTGGGNTVIGYTADPASSALYKLDVNGKTKTATLLVNDGGTYSIEYNASTTNGRLLSKGSYPSFTLQTAAGQNRVNIENAGPNAVIEMWYGIQSNIYLDSNADGYYALGFAYGKTSAPVASAILELSSVSRGLLLPRMTTAQKTAITTPATSLMVYDTDLAAFQYYTGSAWAGLGGGITGSGTAGQVTYWSGTSAVTGSSNLFWDNTNGRLGIGTSSPSASLNISSSTNSSFSGIIVRNTNVGVNATTTIRSQDDSTNFIEIGIGSTAHTSLSNVSFIYTNKSILDLYANADNKLRIYGSTGNVIIQNGGTFSDTGYRLDVNGITRFQGNSIITLGNLSISNSTNTTFTGILAQNTSSGNNATTVLRVQDNSTGFCEFGIGGTGHSSLSNIGYFYTNKSILDFYANAGNKMRIYGSSGNLVIQNSGTFTDGGQRLQVIGSMRVGTTAASAMYWDDTNNRLGIGVTSPTSTLHIQGAGATSATTALTVQNSSSTSLFSIRNDGNIFTGTGVNLMINATLPTRHTATTYPAIFLGNSNSAIMSETFSGYQGINLTANIVRNASVATGWTCQDTTQPGWIVGLNYNTAFTDEYAVFRTPATSSDATFTKFFSIKGTGYVCIGSNVPTALLDISASTTSRSSLRIRSGTAPTSPNDGDIWFTGTDLKIQIGGSTKTFTVI